MSLLNPKDKTLITAAESDRRNCVISEKAECRVPSAIPDNGDTTPARSSTPIGAHCPDLYRVGLIDLFISCFGYLLNLRSCFSFYFFISTRCKTTSFRTAVRGVPMAHAIPIHFSCARTVRHLVAHVDVRVGNEYYVLSSCIVITQHYTFII